MMKEKWRPQTLRLSEEDLEKLDIIAKKMERTRSQTIRVLITEEWRSIKEDRQ